MVRSVVFAFVLAIAMGALGCAANPTIPEKFQKALEKAETLELYSLDPDLTQETDEMAFHGYKVLGKTEVKNEALANLVEAFKKGVAEQDQRRAAGCFQPRHGIRVKLNGKSYDFVICFECVAVAIYMEDQRESVFHVSESPAPVFNKILKDANVKLTAQPRD